MSGPVLEHVYLHRVRYRECDPMGVVYHTHYIDYFEVARTEALREMGLAYKTLEDAGVMMPVIDLAVQYKRPARYDDLLAITSIVRERPRMRLRIDYEVRKAETQPILVTGHVTLCFVDAEHRRPMPAPLRVVEMFDALR